MKFVLFFSILLTSFNVYALAPMLVSQSGDTCIYDDGTVLKSLNCPFRLRVEDNKRESRPLYDPNSPAAKLRKESTMQGINQMSRGMQGLASQLSGLMNKKKMKKVLSEYPNAYDLLREPEFLSWIGTEDFLIDAYTRAMSTKNPSPDALEGLLIIYKVEKMTNDKRFSEWKKTFDDKQLKKLEKSIKKGDISGIKNWLSEWDSYIIKNPVITDSKNLLPEKEETTQATSNQVIKKPLKFAISESDVASLSSKLKTLVPKANDGNLRAQYTLGLSFVKGEGAKENRELGISILEASAEKDHFKSQYALGTIFEREGNYAKAARWYGRAANLGHLESQFRFGWFYTQGDDRGVTKDLTKAKYWFKKASESGHPRAQYLLGIISYGNGETLEAYKWLHISEQNGLAEKYIKSSENFKNKLAKELTESQIENSKRVALACIESSYKNCNF